MTRRQVPMPALVGNPDLSDDIWAKQIEAGRGSRVKDTCFCFMTGDLQRGKTKWYRAQALE